MAIPEAWVIENYEAVVADENRNVTWEQIAGHADELDDASLAAYARERAAGLGVDVTPVDAEPAPDVAPLESEVAPVETPEIQPVEAGPDPKAVRGK